MGLAFAIVLKGIDWQLNGAFKSAAFAFLIAWAVLFFVLYVSDRWDKHRLLVMVAQIVVGIGLIAAWKAYLPTPSVVTAPPPQVIEPQIVMPLTTGWRGMLVPSNEATPPNACSEEKLQPGSLLVLFGNQVAVLGPSDERTAIITIAGEDVLSFVRRDGEISLDSTIRRQSGEVVARIKNNEFQLVASEDYYMERPDAHTLMVISPNKVPVLYVKYLNRSALEFRGVFFYSGPRSLSGTIGRDTPTRHNLRRELFRCRWTNFQATVSRCFA